MDPQVPEITGTSLQNGSGAAPTPIRWGDAVWNPICAPVLEALEAALDQTVRGGPVFRRLASAWRDGVTAPSNLELARTLGWSKSDIAEAYRVIRRHLAANENPRLEVQLPRYGSGLVVLPRSGASRGGEWLFTVPLARMAETGPLIAGITLAAEQAGVTLRCAFPGDTVEQSRLLTAGGYSAYVVLPVDETDDGGIAAAYENRLLTVDIAFRHGETACVSFDYAGAGLYATEQLIEMGCRNVVLWQRDADSRAYDLAAGYRQAMRKVGLRPLRPMTLDEGAVEALIRVQAAGYLEQDGGKLGILCLDPAASEELLTYLDSIRPTHWQLAVACIGGRAWPGAHWIDRIQVGLDYRKLGEDAGRFLATGLTGVAPAVRATYSVIPARKPPSIAAEEDPSAGRRAG